MTMRSVRTAAIAALLGLSMAHSAAAQTAPAKSPPPAETAAPAPAAPAPAAPAPAAAPAAVPPGYMLVPIQPAPAPAQPDTRYDVQYPQTRGALPPGMELPYEEGQPIPPGYHLVKQNRRGLIIAGSITTGVMWVFGLMAAVGNDFKDNTGLLVIPVVGPWALLATDTARDKSCGTTANGIDVCTESKAGLRAVLVLDGIVQTAGAAMFISGFAFPRARLIRNDVTVSFVPTTFGNGGYGVGAIGRF
jgi:hypothetical protein